MDRRTGQQLSTRPVGCRHAAYRYLSIESIALHARETIGQRTGKKQRCESSQTVGEYRRQYGRKNRQAGRRAPQPQPLPKRDSGPQSGQFCHRGAGCAKKRRLDLQGNRISDSLAYIFEPIHRQGESVAQEFQDYLQHWHNIDRMAVKKPVFDESVTAGVSREKISEYEAAQPEFHEAAEKYGPTMPILLRFW